MIFLEKEMNTIMNKDISIFICFENNIYNIFAKIYLHNFLKILFYVYIYIFNKIYLYIYMYQTKHYTYIYIYAVTQIKGFLGIIFK